MTDTDQRMARLEEKVDQLTQQVREIRRTLKELDRVADDWKATKVAARWVMGILSVVAALLGTVLSLLITKN